MNRFLPLCCLCGAFLAFVPVSSAVADDDWMYRRSYFSHTPTPGVQPTYPLPEPRSAYRPAYYREALGFSVRSAYRWNNYVLRNGPRTDRTLYQEGYIEFNP
jgi:hypothetical protein